MSDYITERDPITVHDGRPTHRMKPDWLVDALIAAERAWAEHDRILVVEIHATEAEFRQPDYDKIDAALKRAEILQSDCEQCLAMWQEGE